MVPALAEEQHRGLHARIGLEHAARQRQHRLDRVVLDQLAAQLLVRAGRAEQHALGHDHAAAPARLQAVQHVLEEQQLGRGGRADLHVLDDPVLVDACRRRADWRAPRRSRRAAGPARPARPRSSVVVSTLRRRMRTSGRPRSVRFMVARLHHLRVDVVAVEGAVSQRVAQSRRLSRSPQPRRMRLPSSSASSMPRGRGVGEADVVVGRDEEARGAGGRVVDGLADLAGRPSATMARMMWRGVRNWPSSPACLICAARARTGRPWCRRPPGRGAGRSTRPTTWREHGRLVDARAGRRAMKFMAPRRRRSR